MLRRFLNRSTRPPASTNFCLPVKNGWHLEQISTLTSLFVERVTYSAPHAHFTVTTLYSGCIPCFIFNTSLHSYSQYNLYYHILLENARLFLYFLQNTANLYFLLNIVFQTGNDFLFQTGNIRLRYAQQIRHFFLRFFSPPPFSP